MIQENNYEEHEIKYNDFDIQINIILNKDNLNIKIYGKIENEDIDENGNLKDWIRIKKSNKNKEYEILIFKKNVNELWVHNIENGYNNKIFDF